MLTIGINVKKDGVIQSFKLTRIYFSFSKDNTCRTTCTIYGDNFDSSSTRRPIVGRLSILGSTI